MYCEIKLKQMDINTEIELAEQLAGFLKEKAKCLKGYAEFIKDMADKKSPSIFYQGSCSHCDDLDKKIVEIKTKLTA